MNGGTFLGKYAAVIAVDKKCLSSYNKELADIVDVNMLPKQLCQHVIGKEILILYILPSIRNVISLFYFLEV